MSSGLNGSPARSNSVGVDGKISFFFATEMSSHRLFLTTRSVFPAAENRRPVTSPVEELVRSQRWEETSVDSFPEKLQSKTSRNPAVASSGSFGLQTMC